MRDHAGRQQAGCRPVVLRLTRVAPQDGRRDQLAPTQAAFINVGGATPHVSTLRSRAIAARTADDGRHRAVALKPLRTAERSTAPIGGNSNGWFVWRGAEIPQEDDNFFDPLHVEHLDDQAPGTGAIPCSPAGLAHTAGARLRGRLVRREAPRNLTSARRNPACNQVGALADHVTHHPAHTCRASAEAWQAGSRPIRCGFSSLQVCRPARCHGV